MATFCFASTAELVHAVRYLATYDETIKFALTSNDGGSCTLRLTMAHVPPLSFADVVYDNCAVAPCSGCSAADAHVATLAPTSLPSSSSSSAGGVASRRVCWAVDARTLMRVLATFAASAAVVMELCDDGVAMLLYQQVTQHHRCTRLARLDVLHDVTPELLVSHHVEQYYRIRDVRNFRRVCMAVACDLDAAPAQVVHKRNHDDDNNNDDDDDNSSDDDDSGDVSRCAHGDVDAAAQCRLSLQWRPDGVCELVCETATVKASVRLCDGNDALSMHASAAAVGDDDDGDGGNSDAGVLCGLLRCVNLRDFARLCGAQRAACASSSSSLLCNKSNVVDVCVGFGDNGVALLRLQWRTGGGERTASLYFCRIASDA